MATIPYTPLQYPTDLRPQTAMETLAYNVKPFQQIMSAQEDIATKRQQRDLAERQEQRAYAQDNRTAAQEERSAAMHDLQMRVSTLAAEDKERYAADMQAVRIAVAQGGNPFERLANGMAAAASRGNLELAETYRGTVLALADLEPDPAKAAALKEQATGIAFTPEQVRIGRLKVSPTENVTTTYDPTTGKTTQEINPWGKAQIDARNRAARAGGGGGPSGFNPRAALGMLNTQQQMIVRNIGAIDGQIAGIDAQLAVPLGEEDTLDPNTRSTLNARKAALVQQKAQETARMLAVGQQAQSLLYSGNAGSQQGTAPAAPADPFEAGLAKLLGEDSGQESRSTLGQVMEGAGNIGPMLSALGSQAYALVPPPVVPPEKAYPSIYRPNLLTRPPTSRTPFSDR